MGVIILVIRKDEYFEGYHFHKEIKENVSNFPKFLYYQERDWTCSIAVLRSITSSIVNIGSEDEILEKYNIKMGPNYSKQIKEYKILNDFNLDVLYGCDNQEVDVFDLIELLRQGYYIACEWMINYDHWTVLLGYIHFGNIDEDMLIYYCPYYNEIRKVRLSEFIGMWCSGENLVNNISADFIAVKKK